MEKNKKFISIQQKMNLFIIIIVFAVALGTAAISFYTSVDQIDRYYKQIASDNARNVASMADGDYLMKLRVAVETEEYQQLREEAEENDDEEPIREYIESQGLWDEYASHQKMLTDYLNNIEGIKYLYLIACGDENAVCDMYLVDDESNPIYETGYYEDREEELLGLDLEHLKEPTISNGDWGWLCSAFYPVYTSDGQYVCMAGCDFGMEEVMLERRKFLIYLAAGAVIYTAIVLTAAVLLIRKIVVKPLNDMTREMKKFTPAGNISYDDAGVINLDLRSNDEIGEIYQGIRSMQTNIIDYLNDLSALQEDKIKAELDIKAKERQIGRLSEETYKDPLTGVGSKTAYFKKIEELNRSIQSESAEFALVMVDINNLKQINDDHGHRSGDQYIQGCCNMIGEVFTGSPVFRIGGDEFVVILTGNDYENRFNLLEKLKENYARTFAQENADPWTRYSASLGMAERAFDDATVELVFKRADKAMYADKMKFKEEHGSYR